MPDASAELERRAGLKRLMAVILPDAELVAALRRKAGALAGSDAQLVALLREAARRIEDYESLFEEVESAITGRNDATATSGSGAVTCSKCQSETFIGEPHVCVPAPSPDTDQRNG